MNSYWQTITPDDSPREAEKKRIFWDIKHASYLFDKGLWWGEDEQKFTEEYGFSLVEGGAVSWDRLKILLADFLKKDKEKENDNK